MKNRMSKRDVIRGMYDRAVTSEDKLDPRKRMSLSYVARRIGKTIPEARAFIRWMVKAGEVAAYFDKRSVVFVG